MIIYIYLLGFELGFWLSFDHKSVPAVQGMYSGKEKVNIPAIPCPKGLTGALQVQLTTLLADNIFQS